MLAVNLAVPLEAKWIAHPRKFVLLVGIGSAVAELLVILTHNIIAMIM